MERFSRQTQASGGSQPAAQPARPAAKQSKVTPPSAGSKLLVIVLIVAALSVIGSLAVGVYNSFSEKGLVNDNQYQAVFLDNGQVYFGRMANTGNQYVQLTDIYYLQVDQQVQPEQTAVGEETTAQGQSQISLAKLGNELHGPEDKMFINKDKITFWENLKTDGQVTTAIQQYLETQGTEGS